MGKMSTSHCTSAAHDTSRRSRCNVCNVYCPNHGSICDSAYNPRQENQRGTSSSGLSADAPVAITEVAATKIDSPPLIWNNYGCKPKCLTIKNTGKTVMINGVWPSGRPSLSGGPLNGTYLFSQIHFHSPSEHQINGIRYPLEMHVVHYKTTYLTQEKAMYEKDGTIVVVYLFQVKDVGPTSLRFISKVANCLDTEGTSLELPNMCLNTLAPSFRSNYYVYWGSVQTDKCSYLLQWFVHRRVSCVSRGEVNGLFKIMDSLKTCYGFTRMNPENGEVFYVEEEELHKSQSCTGTCKRSVGVSTCQSNTSNRSARSSRSSTNCHKSPSRLHLRRISSSKHVTIQVADRCTNTTPVSSRSNICKTPSVQKKPCKKKRKEKKPRTKGECKRGYKKKRGEGKASSCSSGSVAVESNCTDLTPQPSAKSDDDKAPVEVVCNMVSDIQTIYEKKQMPQKKEKEDGSNNRSNFDELQVNFLLTPNPVNSNFSNAVNSTGSETESKEEVKTVAGGSTSHNPFAVQGSKSCTTIPTQILIKRSSHSDTLPLNNKAEDKSKEICLLLEHFFRANDTKRNNKDEEGNDGRKGSWHYQEYHVAIECNHNVLQEYNGLLQVEKLTRGNFEKLNLVPKFQEPKNMNIALTDCSVKLENTEDIRIRAKFMVKENALLNGTFHERRTQGILNVLDAETQYAVQEMTMLAPIKQRNHLAEPESDEYIKNRIAKIIEKRKSSFKIDNIKEELTAEESNNVKVQELRKELLNLDTKLARSNVSSNHENAVTVPKVRSSPLREETECTVKASKEGTSTGQSSVDIELTKVKAMKNVTQKESKINDLLKAVQLLKSDRESLRHIKISRRHMLRTKKNSSSSSSSGGSSHDNNKETTYFVYDRIEKDSTTGRKVFIGNFKTKEEIKNLRKCNSSQNLNELPSDFFFSKRLPDHDQERSVNIHEIISQDSELARIEEWCNKQLQDALFDSPSPSNKEVKAESDKKEIIELHKSRPSNFNPITHQLKSDGKKFFVGKVLSMVPAKSKQQQQPSEKTESENASEQGSKKKVINDNPVPTTSLATTNILTSGKQKVIKLNMDKVLSKADNKASSIEWIDVLKFEESNERKATFGVKATQSKDRFTIREIKSKGTVIVIPIEVESLSKIELILVEHTEDDKSERSEQEYIPCLNCYK